MNMVSAAVHERSLATSTALSKYYVPTMIAPIDVIKVLNEAKISFVLVGLHGTAGWMDEPRATQDVDVIVANRQVKKAVRVLLAAFPQLEEKDHPVVVRLLDKRTRKEAIDIVKPLQNPHREIFKHTHEINIEGEAFRIPSLEMAMVLKFAPMVSLSRSDEDQHQDAHDFINIVKKNPEFNWERLEKLGDLVYTGGGKEVVQMAKNVLAGQKLEF